MASKGFSIREAIVNDVVVPFLDAILELITDLAVYEKEPDKVVNTPELLRKNLFETPYAHAILAFEGDDPSGAKAIGLALYFFNYSTWTGRPGLYLEDLYVKPGYRKLGIGKALFGQLGKVAQDKGCSRLDWVVLKWNQPSIDFYEKRLGATAMEDWVGMRLNEDGIERLKEFL